MAAGEEEYRHDTMTGVHVVARVHDALKCWDIDVGCRQNEDIIHKVCRFDCLAIREMTNSPIGTIVSRRLSAGTEL